MNEGLPSPVRQWSALEKSGSYNPIVPVLATWLDDLCRLNASDPSTKHVNDFSAVAVARIAVADYLFRLTKNSACSPQVFVVMFVLLRRMMAANKQVNPYTIHRMMATCFVLAAKLTDDVFYCNSFYARITGLEVRDLNNLERVGLRVIDWNLYISPQDYDSLMQFSREWESRQAARSNAVILSSPTPLDTTSNASFHTAKSSTCESASTSKTCGSCEVVRNTARVLPLNNAQA